jgi:sulfonate transport system substrate-binding protein
MALGLIAAAVDHPCDVLLGLLDLRIRRLAQRVDRRDAHQHADDFEDLIDEIGVGDVLEVEQRTEHVERAMLDRNDTRAASLNRCDAELVELLERLAHGASARRETYGKISFRRQSLAGPVLAAQDLVAQHGRDFVAAREGLGWRERLAQCRHIGNYMIKINIIGVPEHFNLPWLCLLESGACRELGIEARWRDYAEGTGAMVRALDQGRADVACLLTEGAVAAIGNGSDLEIVSQFTDSPLLWGIHVDARAGPEDEAGVRGMRYAISRKGSGSHLMSVAHARARGWPIEAIEFVEVGTLDGAVEALAQGRAEVFFWEKFMTKPLVTAGVFRRVADFAAPWPGFVVCAPSRILGEHRDAVRQLVNAVCDAAEALRRHPDAASIIARRFGLDASDAAEWLELTRWSRRCAVDRTMLDRVAAALNELDLLARLPRFA